MDTEKHNKFLNISKEYNYLNSIEISSAELCVIGIFISALGLFVVGVNIFLLSFLASFTAGLISYITNGKIKKLLNEHNLTRQDIQTIKRQMKMLKHEAKLNKNIDINLSKLEKEQTKLDIKKDSANQQKSAIKDYMQGLDLTNITPSKAKKCLIKRLYELKINEAQALRQLNQPKQQSLSADTTPSTPNKTKTKKAILYFFVVVLKSLLSVETSLSICLILPLFVFKTALLSLFFAL